MPRKPPDGLPEAVATGNQQRALEALRDRLAVEIEESSGTAVAALSKQLSDVLKQLAGMSTKEKSKVDELAKRRAARRKTAQVSDRPTKPVQRRTGGNRTRS